MNDINHAQYLYNMIGSRHLPTPERHAFMMLFKDYCSAITKIESLEGIKALLENNPQIASFSFEVGFESDDEGGAYECIQCIQIIDAEGLDVENRALYNTLYNELSDPDIMSICRNSNISLPMLPEILKNSLTAQEAHALDSIDNFEFHSLQKEIPKIPTNNAKQKL